ncbi:putative phage-type endonuclease [Pseudoduganella lurida]|uniref:Putative phage-type endonuclease n=1 Tax=Pseudoduganella lurida TaxID=1036180 RepID=A0A562RIX5_9BURK|nr:YqaJ viral recombinase family protein [Pseudoduganella lurida]TWI69025.1 putative phage-type endonuclease [Pseudoduganella lurida]
MNAIVDPTTYDRMKYLGGSDIAAILGVSPYRNVVDLWLDKIKPRAESGQNAAAKRRGSRLEPYILDMIREEHGLEIVAANNRYIDAELPYMAAEIDFEYRDPDTGEVENGEIKTVHPFKMKEWGEHGTDNLPLHYVAQVQHGMGVRTASRCRVFALIGDDLKPYVVERDDELIEAMRARAAEFWTKYVLPKVQPPLDYEHKDIIDTIKRLYPGTDGTVIDATAMHEHWRAVIGTAAEMRDHYEAILAGAKAHLLAEMGSAAAIKFADGMAFTRKVISKKAYTVNYDATRYVDFRLAKLKEQA